MRPAQVVDVDVVADARPVRGIVIGSEDGYLTAFSHCGLDYQGDQVRFGAMVLAALGIAAGAARVEVSQRGISQLAGPALIVTHPLDGPLGLAVGINRLFGTFFANRYFLRRAIDGCGAAEDEFFDAGGLHRFEQIMGVAQIVAIVFQRGLHRFADLDKGCKVHHCLDPAVSQGSNKPVEIG